MQIDLTKLLTNRVSSIKVTGNVNIPNEFLKNTRIDELKDIIIDGKITENEEDNLILEGNIKGIMVLEDDITLEPVEYKFDTFIAENLDKNQNILDITDILWQNILVEIPSKVRATFEDIELSGDGWRVISEDKFNEERNKSNNPFQNLDELLNIKEDK